MSSKCYIKYLGKIPNFMIYVILEWTMICILFIDGIVSFASNEIARIFGLRMPCLLCTRFDHILVPRNENYYYNDSICEKHKKNISSLAYCALHKKLSNIKNMCEGCVLSFVSEKPSDRENHKHLVGIPDKDFDNFVEDGNKKCRNREENVESEKIVNGGEKCCCCGEGIKPRNRTKDGRINSIRASFVSPSPRAPAASPRATVASPRAPVASPRAPLASPRGPIASPRGPIASPSRPMGSPRRLWKTDSELPNVRCSNLKFASNNEAKTSRDDQEISTGKEDKGIAAATPVAQDSEDFNGDRTPMSRRANRFFGVSMLDSANTTPRFRFDENSSVDDKVELIPEPTDADASKNEVDGDHIINRLKKEVRLDRRSLIELYMELDEERNASAIAANNAMAMITRLQAEKAAVQMDALQYQRMMEEQAEYDQEAVQVMKDLVEKREEEIDLLEFELEEYRHKFGFLKTVDSEICEVDAEEYQVMKSQSLSSTSDTGSPNVSSRKGENVHCTKDSVAGDGSQDALSLDFDSERSYLLGLLKNLEKNTEQPSEELSSSSPDQEHNSTLAREMSTIRERLKSLEAESGFLKRAAMSIQNGSDGTKLLSEIAEHLRKLRHC